MATQQKSRSRRSKASRHATVVRIDPDVRQGARLHTALTGASLSDQVNEALRARLSAERGLLRKRLAEPAMPYDEFIVGLKRRGRI